MAVSQQERYDKRPPSLLRAQRSLASSMCYFFISSQKCRLWNQAIEKSRKITHGFTLSTAYFVFPKLWYVKVFALKPLEEHFLRLKHQNTLCEEIPVLFITKLYDSSEKELDVWWYLHALYMQDKVCKHAK